MANMQVEPNSVLAQIPEGLKQPLLEEFNKIHKNFRERRWEPAELNGGKFAEVVYSIINGYAVGKFPAKPQKPRNMVDACKAMESVDGTKFCRSIRIQIPRVLVALYEIRNGRGVGHVGGDVNPNHMDSVVVLTMVKWIFGELIRVFHQTTVEEAEKLIESVVQKEMPLVWTVEGVKRILDSKMSKPHQTLVLLHSASGSVSEGELFEWVEHSNRSVFRRDVLKKLHKQRLIEYNQRDEKAQISPRGIEFVENSLLNSN